MSKIKKYKLYLDVVPTSNGPFGTPKVTGATSNNNGLSYMIRRSDGSLGDAAEHDFHINIPIYKSERNYEYIDLQIDDFTHKIERQEFNPFFIEYGFFDTVEFNRINKGSDLDQSNIEYIRKARPDVDSAYPEGGTFSYGGGTVNSSERIKRWYDDNGKFEFPWREGTFNESTKDDLDKSSKNTRGIVSKSTNYPIDINN